MFERKAALTGVPAWRDAKDICTLADADRHLGHIVNTGKWEAFDGIHPNDTGNGFRHLGAFPNIFSAKTAVEQAVSSAVDLMAKSASSGMWIS